MMLRDSQKLGFVTSQDSFKLITSVFKLSCSFLREAGMLIFWRFSTARYYTKMAKTHSYSFRNL